MRIGLLTSWDMTDQTAWSGVVFPAVSTLRQKADVLPLQVPPVKDALIDRLLARLLGSLGYVYLPGDAFATAYRQARQVRKLLRGQNLDAVISLAASKESLGVPSEVPLIQVTDSSFRAMLEGYFKGKKISFLTRIQGQILDRLVGKRSDHYCLASNWSAEQLIKDIGLPVSAVTVAPFGPGIAPLGQLAPSEEKQEVKVLFIASNWKRKGGARALESFTLAQATRPSLSLTVVGAPQEIPTPGVAYLPRQSQEELSALYLSHDVLLEPTEASAGGVVVTDALNHGLPVISTRVGGIPTLVRERETGWLVSPDRAVEEIVSLLIGLTRDELERASIAACQDARTRLSWDSWGQAVFEVCQQVVAKNKNLK